MIFAIWYSSWVIIAVNSMTLVFPGIALVIRSFYLNRTILKAGYLLLTTVIFLWLVFLSQVEWQNSLMRALQVLAFLCLTAHLLVGANEIKLRALPTKIVMIKHLIGRYLKIVSERLDDIRYACKIRKDHAYRVGLWKPKTIIAFGTSVISECLVLVNHLSMIINSRGIMPHPSKWQKEKGTKSRYFIGDIALFVLIIFISTVSLDKAIPEPITRHIYSTKEHIERIIIDVASGKGPF